MLSNGIWRQSPLNAVGFEQHNQAGIFGLEGFELQGLIDLLAVHPERAAVKAESSPK